MELKKDFTRGQENAQDDLNENFSKIETEINSPLKTLYEGALGFSTTAGESIQSIKGYSKLIVVAGSTGDTNLAERKMYLLNKNEDAENIKFTIQVMNLFDTPTSANWEAYEADVTIEGLIIKIIRSHGVNQSGTIYNDSNAIRVRAVYGIM